MEFELGTKHRDEIPDTAWANIDSLLVPNSSERNSALELDFSKGPRDRNINVPRAAPMLHKLRKLSQDEVPRSHNPH